MRSEQGRENRVEAGRGNNGTSCNVASGGAQSVAENSSETLSRDGFGKLIGSNALIDFLTISCTICATSG